MAIPFRSLRFPGADVQQWGIALARNIPRVNEESFWPYITRRIARPEPQMAVATGAKLKLAAPIRGSHGNSAAMAFDVQLNMPQGPALIRVIDTFKFDAHGKFTSMRAFWGPSDMEMPG